MTENQSNCSSPNRPRIYVASLADYTAGRLYGCWIDADQPAETIREQITAMLAQSRDPSQRSGPFTTTRTSEVFTCPSTKTSNT